MQKYTRFPVPKRLTLIKYYIDESLKRRSLISSFCIRERQSPEREGTSQWPHSTADPASESSPFYRSRHCLPSQNYRHTWSRGCYFS